MCRRRLGYPGESRHLRRDCSIPRTADERVLVRPPVPIHHEVARLPSRLVLPGRLAETADLHREGSQGGAQGAQVTRLDRPVHLELLLDLAPLLGRTRVLAEPPNGWQK